MGVVKVGGFANDAPEIQQIPGAFSGISSILRNLTLDST